MTKFYVETPNQNLRVTTTQIYFPDLETGERVTRWRAKERLSGIDTGGETERDAYYNLIQFVASLQ